MARQLSLDPAEPLPDAVEDVRRAAGAWVERQRRDLFTGQGIDQVGGDVLAGATLMVARLSARKGSPLGLASFAEFGPSAVLKLDPDIERLLGLGRYAKPVVG